MLPELIRRKYSFEPGTEDEMEECGRLLWLQTTQAAWLDHLLTVAQSPTPDQIPIPAALADPINAVVKVRGNLSKAVLDLARHTFDQAPMLRTTNRPTPESIWFAWEVQNFENMVWCSGLITGQATNRQSKQTVYDNFHSLASILETADPHKLPPSTEEVTHADELLGDLEALLLVAYGNAVSDYGYRYSRPYLNFHRTLRAWSRECRTNSFWILPEFENGKRLPGGRKSKRTRR